MLKVWLALGLSAASAADISVLSYNIHGIPVVAPRLNARVAGIGHALGQARYDVVALQEVWRVKDQQRIAALSSMPYSAFFPSGPMIGSGLSILSRYPIVARAEQKFSLRPSLLRLASGEPLASKAALMARIQLPSGALDVYNSHLISFYPESRYYTLRIAQIFELAEFIERQSGGNPFLLMADLNATVGEDEYDILADLLGLENACFSDGRDTCGPTSDTGRAIDHVLAPAAGKRLLAGRLALDAAADGRRLSDHAAVEARVDARLLRIKPTRDQKRRIAALRAVESAADNMIGRMHLRLRTRSWIPVYGFLMGLRYDRQIATLLSIRSRAETARILAQKQR